MHSHRVSKAFAAQGSLSLVGKVANLVLSVALARLLYPEDFGLFTVTIVVTGLANMLSNFGFQSYVIQAPEVSPQVLNTCYTLNVGFSFVLGFMLVILGKVWPGQDGMLSSMLGLYGLFVFVSGLSYIELAILKRQLRFSSSAQAELAYTVVSMSGRVAFAAAHLGAMCFPLGDVLGALVRWILARQLCSSTPARLAVPDPKVSREAIAFGVHATSAGLASFVANQSDKALVSAAHPAASVGLYGFGSSTASMFYNAFILPQSTVFLSAFARLRDDKEAARRLLALSSRVIFSLSLPVNVLCMLEPEVIIGTVFGQRWLGAAPLVRIFAVDFLVRSMFSGITGLQMSFGLAASAAKTKWANAFVFVLFLGIASLIKANISGFAIAYVAASLVATFHNIRVNGRLIGIDWGEFALNLVTPALLACASTIIWWFLRPEFDQLTGLWKAISVVSLWLAGYAILSFVFNRAVFVMLLSALRISRGDKLA